MQGPYGKRKALGFGRFTLIPSDYWDVFKAKNIRAIVRLNNKEYDRAAFIQAGFIHHDLFFTDCSTPSDDIVDKFLRLAEEQEGSIAVHCLAGLGRTGTLIAMWMMKHQGWTANECIAWLRIVRPGSIIGPQQQYLKDQEERMWALGQRRVPGLGVHSKADQLPMSPGRGKALFTVSIIAKWCVNSVQCTCMHARASLRVGICAGNSTSSQELAQQITKGLQIRDQGRILHNVNSEQHS